MTAAGFPPSARLRSAADFAALRTAQRSQRGQFFHIRYMDSAGDTSRLGMAVSRKTSKRAVVRNRIKRIARESFRHARVDLPVVDILVIARAAAATATRAELRVELDLLWTRLRQQTGSKPVHHKPTNDSIDALS